MCVCVYSTIYHIAAAVHCNMPPVIQVQALLFIGVLAFIREMEIVSMEL